MEKLFDHQNNLCASCKYIIYVCWVYLYIDANIFRTVTKHRRPKQKIYYLIQYKYIKHIIIIIIIITIE